MSIPLLPESAPFTAPQRAWLNGFFAGLLSVAQNGKASLAPGALEAPAAEPEAEDFPWHDAALAMPERLQMAEGRPFPRVLMAAMAQLDCGSCGYNCQTYAEVIASGTDKDLTKCSPGGKETSKKLKELMANKPADTGVTPAVPAAPKPVSDETGYDRDNPFPAPILEIRALTRKDSAKDVRFVSLGLKGSGLTYEAGDALGVYPENCPDLVDDILREMDASGDEPVRVPEGRIVPSRIALAKAFVINRTSDDFLDALAELAAREDEQARLKHLAQDDTEGFLDGRDVLDILQEFPSARPRRASDVGWLLAKLSPLRPRLYSISSSMKAHPDEVHLTIGVVRYGRHESNRQRKGVCSTFLSERVMAGHKAGVFVQPSHGFKPPTDPKAPMMMVGPGTGIAPFRAFLEERRELGHTGPNWLFFGDQRRATDFLYQTELEEYQASGVLNKLDLAFSRDQTEKVYVQHKMLENGAEMWRWFEEGGHFYVCGDASRMAKDVDAALHRIAEVHGGLSADGAKDYIAQLAKTGRYGKDVY